LRTDCTVTGGGGGGSTPKASSSVSGTVKTDATESDPVVYLKSSADALLAIKAPLAHGHAESDVTNLVIDLAAKVPTTRTISTSSPLSGGGTLGSDLTLSCPTCVTSAVLSLQGQTGNLTFSPPGTSGTAPNWSGLTLNIPLASAASVTAGLISKTDYDTFNGKENVLTFNSPLSRSVNTVSCPTCSVTGHTHAESDVINLVSDLAAKEATANKNAANGYAGLTASTKLNLAQMQEVMAAGDLSDLSGLFGSSPGTKAVTTALASDPTTDNCVKWIAGGKLGDAGAACGTGGGGGITTLNGLTATTQYFATPGTSGTAPNWSSVTDTHTLNIPLASASSVTAGLISKTDYDTFNGKPNLVTAGGSSTAGPYDQGDATTAARSDHDHRSIAQLAWFFAGTPGTGAQAMTLTFPEGTSALAIMDMRVTVSVTSTGSSAVNIQRCTASCTGTSPTFSNIYSTDLTLAANTRTAAKGSAPDQNVSGLAAGDQFRVYLTTIGSALSGVTVTMSYKYATTN
jgi:hypothetical protein